MRRNDIVLVDDHGWCMYGRINRVVDVDYAEVIDCGKYVRILHKSRFEIHNHYKGYPGRKPKHFCRMPTLRKLKQITSQYNKTVWKKYRKKGEGIELWGGVDERIQQRETDHGRGQTA